MLVSRSASLSMVVATRELPPPSSYGTVCLVRCWENLGHEDRAVGQRVFLSLPTRPSGISLKCDWPWTTQSLPHDHDRKEEGPL